MSTIKLCKTTDILPGKSKIFTVENNSVAVFNVDNKFHAIDNVCLHRGGPLGDGELNNNVVTCPWHGWNFNVETGDNANIHSLCLTKYDVKVNGEDIELTL